MQIQIIKIFKHSFQDVWNHMLEWVRVAFAPLLVLILGTLGVLSLWIASGSYIYFLTPFQALMNQAISSEQLVTDLATEWGPFLLFLIAFSGIIYLFIFALSLTNFYIKGFRYAVLREGGTRWWLVHFNGRVVKIILYFLLLGLLGSAYAGIVYAIGEATYSFLQEQNIVLILYVILSLYGIYLFARLSLCFLLISIDKKEPLRTSWHLLKGHVLRFIGLLVLLTLALSLITIAGTTLFAFLGTMLAASPWIVAIISILGLLFSFFMWFFSWAVGTKAVALVYQTVAQHKA